MKKIQYKLFLTFLLTSALPLIVVGFITIVFLGRMGVTDAQQRIKGNLKIAQNVYESVKENLKYTVRDQNRRIYTLIGDDQIDLLKNEYRKVVKENRLDFFVVTDNFGRVLVSMTNPQFEGLDYSRDYFIRQALRRQTIVSTEILDAQEAEHLGIKTKAGIPGLGEVRALVIKTSMPLINNNEIIVGTMTAGYCINNNNAVIVDKITQDSSMVASIFMEDTRVSSNVPFLNSATPLGTKLYAKAATALLKAKKDYFGRMNVSGHCYQAGYTPLYNSRQEVVGILGVGIDEKEIFARRDQLTKLFVLAVVLSVLLSLGIGFINGGAIVRSVNKLYWGIEAFARGDYAHRIEIHSRDELEELGDFFNKTLTQIVSTKRQLEAYSRDVQQLENQVTKSTAELEAAQKQLLQYERMAAMGRMATAISHELRNVFAEIHTGLDVLKTKMSKDCPQFLPHLQGVEQSLRHASETLTEVLRFSYPKKLILSDVDVNYLVATILAQPQQQEMFRLNRIEVVRELDPAVPKIKADGLQLREAVLNLVVNAAQAMPEGGRLGVFTTVEKDSLHIRVADTGSGLTREAKENLFTPFFTTKSKGLGLGLAITKSVIQEHGGSIDVFSEPDRGTTFIITLPVARTTDKGG